MPEPSKDRDDRSALTTIADAEAVEGHVARIFDAADAPSRADILRKLFVEVLDFGPDFGDLSLAGAAESVELPANAERVAVRDGLYVAYVALETQATDRVRKAEAAEAAKQIADLLGDDLLLVFTNRSVSQLHFIHPMFDSARPSLRRMVVERDLPRRTAVTQIAGIYSKADRRPVHEAIAAAFDVEPVTKAFFEEYKAVFKKAETRVAGFGKNESEARRLFVQNFFNRLMFIYFLSRKGWLRFNGEKDYLNALWNDYRASNNNSGSFYKTRLHQLFFKGLNNPTAKKPKAIGDVPFLNGGLFEMSEQDEASGIDIPDEAIEPILRDLFDRFNFTVLESTPLDIEVAVDPEMLGKVFEELVTGRNDSGAYYTPRHIVTFMCREALKGYLEGCETSLTSEEIADFVDEQSTSAVSVAAAPKLAAALSEVTVVDPACGSGAYLLGMMQELVELQAVLYNVGVDDRSLYDLKLEIIQRNLYGVDIDEFAVNIAMLRLWLSLAIEGDPELDPPPLPNLDFKIVCGDSIRGPNPSKSNLSLDGVLVDYSELGKLKADFLRSTVGTQKERLRAEIDATMTSLRVGLGDAVPDRSFDWRVEFAEVFATARGGDSGFDIVIANPPYVQLQRDHGRLGKLYGKVGYQTFARTGDIYQLFYERGCQLLKPSSGLLVFITSNSWLRAEYGKATRRFFATEHTPLAWLDLGKDVFESAIVDSGVLLLRTGKSRKESFPAVDMERVPKEGGFPPPAKRWHRIRPAGDGPWSILSKLEQSVLDKMYARGTPLRDWDISINYGIKTGLNDAFIIDNETKEALVAEDPRSAEILKPVLRGRDIQRYRAQWAGKWLITTLPSLGLSIDEYPAVRKHLLSFGRQRLEQTGKRLSNGTRSRKKTGHAWYETQDTCAYHAEFSKPKIFWMEMTPQGRFSYSEGEMYCNNKASAISGGALKYLCAVLNSSLVTWLLRNTARTTGLGLISWERLNVERIPVPHISRHEQRPFAKLVEKVISAKKTDLEDSSRWEQEVDRLVYRLYGLTPEEITVVGDFLK